MSQTAVLVWLSASSLLPTFHADLDAFAQARLFRLEAPRENAASFAGGASAYAPDAVAHVESSLEEARNAAGALEPDRALAALERAEHVLRDHAELPQSAWLMAEILELSADVERTAPGGADAERALRRRAAALEGPRATPFSDRASADELQAEPPVAIEIQGLESGDTVEWDGMQSAPAFSTAPGEHHVRVARNGRLLWAGWTRVVTNANASASPTQLRLPVPEAIACSSDDIGPSRFIGARALAAPHARCPSYVLARPHPTGGIEAAVCERETCGAIVLWKRVLPSPKPIANADKTHLWPYAVAATAAVLAATGLALWRAGAFDRPKAGTNEHWVYEPAPKPMGFRF